MFQTVARLYRRLPFVTQQIAVASIANAAYDRGWQDREAQYLTEHATAGKAAAA